MSRNHSASAVCMNPARTVNVSRPNMRHEQGMFRTWAVMAQNVYGSRELIWQLFKRDFLGAYKKSFLGLAWAILTPLSAVVMWLFLRGTGMFNPGESSVPYPVYVLLGTTVWTLFMGILTAAGTTLQSGSDLVLQVNFPHEILLFKQVAQNLATSLFSLVFCVAVALCFRVVPSPWALLFPLVALPLFFLAAGIGLLLSLIGVVAMDLSKAVNLLFPLLMFASPIVYTSEVDSPFAHAVIRWNPLTYLVCSCRDLILFGRLYDPLGYATSALGAFLFFMMAWRLFYVSENKLIERMV